MLTFRRREQRDGEKLKIASPVPSFEFYLYFWWRKQLIG
jgi:hypothetical protein